MRTSEADRELSLDDFLLLFGYEGNTHPLLVGMQTCAATVEISVAVSQEIGRQPTSGSSNTTLGNIPKRYPIILQKHLFNYVHNRIILIARTWEQPRCPSMEEWIKKSGTYTH